MSSYSNEPEDKKRVSKVTFSPISSDILVVKIRKVSCEVREEDIQRMSNTFCPIPKNAEIPGNSENPGNKDKRGNPENPGNKDKRGNPENPENADNSRNQKNPRIPDNSGTPKNPRKLRNKSQSKYTMTDIETYSVSSQTIHENTNSDTHDSAPCLKHAAENISRKAAETPSEKISLCSSCSKSMLSYIFVVQDFLDSLAREISGNAPHCLQCAREEIRNNIAMSSVENVSQAVVEQASRVHSESKQMDVPEGRHATRRTSKSKVHRQDSRKNGGPSKSSPIYSLQGHTNQQRQQTNFAYSVFPPSNVDRNDKTQNVTDLVSEKYINEKSSSPDNQYSNDQQSATANEQNHSQQNTADVQDINRHTSNSHGSTLTHEYGSRHEEVRIQTQVIKDLRHEHHAFQSDANITPQRTNGQPLSNAIFTAPMERIQPNYDAAPSSRTLPLRLDDRYQDNHCENVSAESPTLYQDGVDGIVSTLSNVEREIYDGARNRAGWEGLSEPQERLGLPLGSLIASEAFVTSCRNNAEAIGCLVVGTSLLLCRTTRTLCVLVADGVSTAFRSALSSVFQVVQYVRSLDSLGTTKLALVEQPELGITFDKLNIWRLTQFSKCVYLNPDTLVIQNCDELFCRDELSAVPDIGWPDCFNSGVFVYSPSLHTFWQLLEFSEKQGSYDGGDQGLLNSYYTSWSTDISKKLSFIYNLMANVSYTYTPAFRHFGRDVKIVQFHGSFKPWHVKFFSKTGQISPSSPVHPTYVQFVHIWLSIFRISVLRLMSQEIQSYAASQETICAVEILRFFPLPSEPENEFFLTPPSVRLRLAEKKLRRSTSLHISETRRRKSAEVFRYTNTEDDPQTSSTSQVTEQQPEDDNTSKSDADAVVDPEKKALETSVSSDTDEVFKEVKSTLEEKTEDENALPGAEVGNYQGMKAWEQGRMDYQGSDSSDNVIKRLKFLMSRPN